jgi:4-phospho-D-threonate 3-dehydrogenase / 4-phospho-D-erythronate 3-dehydrogenase
MLKLMARLVTAPLGITMGDPSGVGPEILLKALAEKQIGSDVVVFGDSGVFRRCSELLDLPPLSVPLVEVGPMPLEALVPGQLSSAAGAAARSYVVAATEAALKGDISAIVTLPVNKEAIQKTDPKFSGHTELIGDLCGAPDVTIMLVSDQLIVTHISTHLSLQQAIQAVTKQRVEAIVQLTAAALKKLRPNGRIAVAGLNPHAGENGLFGQEEIAIIRPALESCRTKGISVEGPLPPDTLFYLAVRKRRYDAVVCMYHDQGHIPLKLLDFEEGVNVTLGLPIVRTSVDHGTAFDIAWQGKASTRSFVRACEVAKQLISQSE